MSTHVPINGNQSRAHELVKVFAFLYINAYVFRCLYIYVYVCQCFQNMTVLQSEYEHNQIHRTV